MQINIIKKSEKYFIYFPVVQFYCENKSTNLYIIHIT